MIQSLQHRLGQAAKENVKKLALSVIRKEKDGVGLVLSMNSVPFLLSPRQVQAGVAVCSPLRLHFLLTVSALGMRKSTKPQTDGQLWCSIQAVKNRQPPRWRIVASLLRIFSFWRSTSRSHSAGCGKHRAQNAGSHERADPILTFSRWASFLLLGRSGPFQLTAVLP